MIIFDSSVARKLVSSTYNLVLNAAHPPVAALMCVFASRVPDSSGRRLHTVQLRVWRGAASLPTTALQVAAFRLVAGRCAARSSRARRALRRCCAICGAVAASCKPWDACTTGWAAGLLS